MGRPEKPRLSPVYRKVGGQHHLIPAEELGDQLEAMERYGTWALQQGLNIADGLIDGDPENPIVLERRMGRFFAIAGACLGAINGRANAFRTLQEIRDGKLTGGSAQQYARGTDAAQR